MIVTYNKAEIVEDEYGKKFLHLELQAFMPGTKTIIQNTFPATSNFNELELCQTETKAVALLTSAVQKDDTADSISKKSVNK